MKLNYALAAVLLGTFNVGLAAYAAEAPAAAAPKVDISPVATTLTMEQAFSLYSALGPNGLSKRAVMNTANGGGGETQAFHFKLPTVYAIAVDLKALTEVISAYQEELKAATDDALAAHPEDANTGPDKAVHPIKVGSKTEAEVSKKIAPLYKASQAIQLIHLRLSNLNIGDDSGLNNIPPDVLTQLLPIVDND